SYGMSHYSIARRRRDDLHRTPVVALIEKADVQEAGGEQDNFEIGPADNPSTQRYVLCLPRSGCVCEICLHVDHVLVVFVVPVLQPEATAKGSFTLFTDLISGPLRYQLVEVA